MRRIGASALPSVHDKCLPAETRTSTQDPAVSATTMTFATSYESNKYQTCRVVLSVWQLGVPDTCHLPIASSTATTRSDHCPGGLDTS